MPSVEHAQAPVSPQSYKAAAAPSSYQTAPGPAPQMVDPWQAAYQRLSGGLNGMPQSQPQAPYWQQAPQAAPSPAYYPSPTTSYPAAFSTGIPISLPQVTPVYSPSYPSVLQNVPAQYAPTQAPQEVEDGYLSGVSNESLEVLQHFGAEAPALLNRYACTVEDALLAQAEQTGTTMQQLQQLAQNMSQMEVILNAAIEDNNAYNYLTTDPDLLADYVNDFFGPEGPAPVELPQDRLRAEVEANQRPYQRPEMPMPAPSGRGGGVNPEDFWAQFNEVATTRPDQLWMLLDQVQNQAPELLTSKWLVSEG
jgi:hypothetical protein